MGGILTQLKIANSVKRVAVFRGEIYIELNNQSRNGGFSLMPEHRPTATPAALAH